ncbi:hypothetical protein [Ferruginibacter albus]|uniref:hypothetical protein n=1 Tax=Ferruginibacter albus TaxID=2875540 RepID=UPI001CC73BC9|nr:hypothetical protein [Ferruginibacter albus]UAY51118.1 hypothetical protein K9M53_11005 [Ferruginibacter albus]
MSEDLKDILSNSNKDIDNQQLMQYLQNQLSSEQQHDVERSMADDPFVNDAVEGLQSFDAKKNVQSYVNELHDNLQKQLAKKKKRKDKRRWKDQPWVYLAIAIILLLLLICFVVVRKYLGY